MGIATAKIFGIGLSRTGTTSLTAALRTLGFRTVHAPEDAETVRQITRCVEQSQRTLELTLLRQVDALTDTPVCCVYQALDAAYPGSRFVLTVRQREAWLDSCERFWRTRPNPNSYWQLIRRALYGTVAFDRAAFRERYDRYMDDVHEHFAGRDDLLVLELCSGQGWEALCSFLGRPLPTTEFPHRNATPAIQQRASAQ